jgi:6-phosphofructokinase 1
LQRCGAHLASQTDIDEARGAGEAAVRFALSGASGAMVALERREADGKYACDMALRPLVDVANAEKKVPVEWISPSGGDMGREFYDYALPLISGEPSRPLENGLPRFARLKKIRVR